VTDGVLHRVVCVRCGTRVDVQAVEIACSGCGQTYPRVGRIPVLLPRPEAHVELWRRQLANLTAHANGVKSALEQEAGAPGVLPAASARVKAMARAVKSQIDEIVDAVGPALGGPLQSSEGGLPRGVVEYGYCLHRDWAWGGENDEENEEALGAIRAVAGVSAFGRLIVLGAGGCRLAYDLHGACDASETVVVDIDPYLLVVAEAIVRGQTVALTESSLNVCDADHVSARRALHAPHGPLGADRFHFLFANGLDPPFADRTFDTVVTPWFIDRVPADLEAFIARLARLVRPGGRWINQGPLLYASETPVSRRHAREEIFDLAERAGFRIAKWTRRSRPYLVSPLTGRGRVETLLTFVAIHTA